MNTKERQNEVKNYLDNFGWMKIERLYGFIIRICEHGYPSVRKFSKDFSLGGCIGYGHKKRDRLGGLRLADISRLVQAHKDGNSHLVRGCIVESMINYWREIHEFGRQYDVIEEPIGRLLVLPKSSEEMEARGSLTSLRSQYNRVP